MAVASNSIGFAWQLGGGSGGSPSQAFIDACKPTDVDSCCSALVQNVNLLSSTAYVTNPGITTVGRLAKLTCENCDDNCDEICRCFDPPCPVAPARICQASVSFTSTVTSTATLHSALTIGMKGFVEAELGAALGVAIGTSVTIQVSCDLPTPECANYEGEVEQTKTTGRTAKVYHDWRLDGVWQDVCMFDTCPIAGNSWWKTCPSTPSVGRLEREEYACTLPVSLPCSILVCP